MSFILQPNFLLIVHLNFDKFHFDWLLKINQFNFPYANISFKSQQLKNIEILYSILIQLLLGVEIKLY